MRLSSKIAKLALVLVLVFWCIVLGRLVGFGLPNQARIDNIVYGHSLTLSEIAAVDQQRAHFFSRLASERSDVINAEDGDRDDTVVNLRTYRQLYTKIGNYDEISVSSEMRIAMLRNALLWGLYDDESATLSALSQIRPSQMDFDPKTYMYGGAYLYTVGTAIFLSDQIGFIEISRSVGAYLTSPQGIAALYVILRSVGGVAFLVLLVLVFALTRRLGGNLAGVLAILALSGAGAVWGYAFLAKPHVYATAWSVLSIYSFVQVATDKGGTLQARWLALAAVSGGLAMGSAIGQGLVAVAAPVFLLRQNDVVEGLKHIALVWIGMAMFYFATNPYVLLNFDQFYLDVRLNGAQYNRTSMKMAGVANYLRELFLGIGVVGAFLAVVGMMICLVNKIRPSRRLIILICLAVIVGGGYFWELRLTRFVIPMLCVFAGLGGAWLIESQPGRIRATVGPILAVLLILQFALPVYYSLSLLSATEKEIQTFHHWVRHSLPAEATIGLSAFPVPGDFTPPLFRHELQDVRPATLSAAGIDSHDLDVDFIFKFGRDNQVGISPERYDLVYEAYGPEAPTWLNYLGRFPVVPWRLWLQVWSRV